MKEVLYRLDKHIKAQKKLAEGCYWMAGLLLFLAIGARFFGPDTLVAEGFYKTAGILTFIMLLRGFHYRYICNVRHKRAVDSIASNDPQLLKEEYRRIERRVKAFVLYQIIVGMLIVLGIVLTLVPGFPILRGASYAMILMFIGVIVVRGVIHPPTRYYLKELERQLS
ncbi:hypothetical protein [Algivirga pacifica]|uniref:Transmembrane protein n=1 Tax=Algivirga pacifica TaxID=1162670 RepID=A0ABP9D5D9_9BACT